MALLFSKEARRQFDPIAKQFGLNCVKSNEQGLRYENDNVFLEVNFDNGRSYELVVEIGKRHTQYLGSPFSLAEILKLRGIEEAKAVSRLMNSDQTRLQGILSTLVRLTRDHASDFLMGNDLSFTQVQNQRNKESSEFELDSQLRNARSIVDEAWPVKDYKAIVNVLEPLDSHLSNTEKKQLEYSRKHLSK